MTTCTPFAVRTGALAVVFGLSLTTSGLAFAATTGPSTVRAVIGADGKVTSVSRTGDGAAPSADSLPITMAISGSQAGDLRTTTYHVENTTSKTESLPITGADGTVTSVEQTVQTPYVAQLHVSLPASLTDVVATGAEIVSNADGSHELTWSMVLFSPVGSPVNEVSFASKGSGSPVARLESMAVSPNGTQGLGATGQAANAVVAGNGTLGAFAAGANDGLTKLATGAGQLIAGLTALKSGAEQLHTGLGAGADGTNKLSAGLNQLSDGTGKVAAGTELLHHGTGQLVGGLQLASDGSVKLVNGSQDLATGAGLTAAGAAQLAHGLPDLVAGLTLLDGGLAKLGVELPLGLKAAQQQVKDAINTYAIGAYIGSSSATGTLLNGLALVGGGLSHPAGALGSADPGGVKEVLSSVIDGLDAAPSSALPLGGAKQALTSMQALLGCSPDPAPSACLYVSNPSVVGGVPAPVLIQQAFVGLIAGLGSRTTPGQTALFALTSVVAGVGSPSAPGTLLNGVTKLSLGLDHPSLKNADGTIKLGTDGKPLDPGGLKQFLAEQIEGGIDQVTAGVSAALLGALGTPTTSPTTTLRGGVAALKAGATLASGGAVALADGTAKVAAGAGQLSEQGAVPISDGLAKLLAGGQQLDAGVRTLNDGAKKLDAGAKAAAVGGGQLAAGLPAAVVGSGQIADGAGKLLDGTKAVGKGLSDVKSQATDILASQLSTGTNNAKVQLATLDATSARLTSDPGAVGTTYVLTQNASATGLNVVKSSSDSHAARNVGLGAGGALLLLAGLGTGFISGRRKAGAV